MELRPADARRREAGFSWGWRGEGDGAGNDGTRHAGAAEINGAIAAAPTPLFANGFVTASIATPVHARLEVFAPDHRKRALGAVDRAGALTARRAEVGKPLGPFAFHVALPAFPLVVWNALPVQEDDAFRRQEVIAR